MGTLPSLLLFARSPVLGRVKTRLVPPLTPERALSLYVAFLEDAARACLAPEAWNAVLEAEPEPDHPELSRLFPFPWRRRAQAPGDLGARLEAAFAREFEQGAPAVVAVGSDHPTVARGLVARLFDLIAAGKDAALIPAEDGGYCAIGLAAGVPVSQVFREVPWSTDRTLAVTLERLGAAGLSVAQLESAYDVDRPEDLARLKVDLDARDPAQEDYPRATARALAEAAS